MFTQNELENQAAQTLLNEKTTFKIKGLGTYSLKNLYLGTLVSISKDALLVEQREGATILNVIASTRKNARPAARIVAKAILNGRFKIMLFTRLFASILMWKLTPKELNELVTMIVHKTRADFFFNCTTLLAGMRVMAPTTQETNQSGEQSLD